MPQDILDFINAPDKKHDYLIDQLISADSGYGIVCGRTGWGKTNLLLNLGAKLAVGEPFLNLQTKRQRVLYLGFEGGEGNLKDRCTKIVHRTFPEPNAYLVERTDSILLNTPAGEDKFLQLIENFDVVLLDPIKWMVGPNYTKPGPVSAFTAKLTKILHDQGKIAIISVQFRKRDPRHKIEPGELDEVKGAQDYTEDACFAILMEGTEMRGKSVPKHEQHKYITAYFAKTRENTRDLPPVELYYDFSTCDFTIM